jgi:hypothetical protein
MSAFLFTLGLVVWLVAAAAFVRIVLAWLAACRTSPAGQGLSAAIELGRLNLPALEHRLGTAAGPIFRKFRTGVIIFAGCVAALIVLVIINIASGNAA